jgi:beta-galactosidase
VAYDKNGKPAAEKSLTTAGKPYAIKLEADRTVLSADAKDLCYVTATIVDKNGNVFPWKQR